MVYIKHHAKRLFHLTPAFVHGMVIGTVIGVFTVAGLRFSTASAVTIVSARDCDSNAVMNCGALTTAEIQKKYDNKGVSQIYNYFGIGASDINKINKTAVAGHVYKDGTVKVNGVTVATNARTAGREYISGSQKVTVGKVTFFTRKPSVSFRPNSLAAFVVMENGQFQFALLGACGNPVNGDAVPKPNPIVRINDPPRTIITQPVTPVPTPTPLPTPTPTPVPSPSPVPTPTPTPDVTPPTPTPPVTPAPETPTVDPTPVETTTPTTPSTQTPDSTPTATLTTSMTPATLPNTGPGSAIIIGSFAVIGGYLFHTTHRRVKRRRQARHGIHHGV